MSEIITEALLEMHFHRAIVEEFKKKYGSNFLKILKPSPQQEAWIGFDQGWVRTSIKTRELFNRLSKAIQSNTSDVKNFYFGYFLQFKKVEEIKKSSRYKPNSYIIPYLRSELSLNPNKLTGLSQHETLIRLNKIENTTVWYCCAMLFNLTDVWKDPDVNRLRFIDISSAPSGWATNQRHFITFQRDNDINPLWFSEPTIGEFKSIKEWISGELKNSPKKLHPIELQKIIEDSISIFEEFDGRKFKRLKLFTEDVYTHLLPECFTIIEFEK